MSRPTESQSTTPSERRTILGVVVHLLGQILPIIGVGAVYLITNDEFTKANARNALNWWLFVFLAGIAIAVLGFGLGAAIDVFVIVAALLAIIVGFLGFGFSIWATVKAVGGTAWKYPLAPNLL